MLSKYPLLTPEECDAIVAQLDRLQEKVNHVKVMVFYAEMLYILNVQILLVCGRLERSR